MREQPSQSVQVVQKIRVPDSLLAQGAPIRAAAQNLGVTAPPYQQSAPQGDTANKSAQPSTLKEMPKGIPRKPMVAPGPKFGVRRDESWEMFGLFMDAILADLAVTRMGPPSDLPRRISPKLSRALFTWRNTAVAPRRLVSWPKAWAFLWDGPAAWPMSLFRSVFSSAFATKTTAGWCNFS